MADSFISFKSPDHSIKSNHFLLHITSFIICTHLYLLEYILLYLFHAILSTLKFKLLKSRDFICFYCQQPVQCLIGIKKTKAEIDRCIAFQGKTNAWLFNGNDESPRAEDIAQRHLCLSGKHNVKSWILGNKNK